jgi:hypothetical protein
MEHLMMDKGQVVAVLTRINGNVEVVSSPSLMRGRFTLASFPFRNGPKPTSCRFQFLPRVSEPSEVVIRISSTPFKPLMSDEALERWVEYMNDSNTMFRVLASPHRGDFHERLVSLVVERKFVLAHADPKTFSTDVARTVMFWQRTTRALEMRTLSRAIKDKRERDTDAAIAEGLAKGKAKAKEKGKGNTKPIAFCQFKAKIACKYCYKVQH